MSRFASRKALIAASLVGVLAIGLIVVLATRSTAPGTLSVSSLGGKVAPDITGKSIEGDKTVNLQSFRGRYVVLDFFASWCQPCIAEVPQLSRFVFEHRRDDNVAVLGVDIDDSLANGSAFLSRVGATWPAIEDANGQIAESYGVVDPPQSFLIDPQGKVIATFGSGVTSDQLDAVLAAARSVSSS